MKAALMVKRRQQVVLLLLLLLPAWRTVCRLLGLGLRLLAGCLAAE
jgi:hypothetical protein